MAYLINKNECVACGICITECPVNAISEGEIFSINPDICVGCGSCEDVCPSGAIILAPRMEPSATPTVPAESSNNSTIASKVTNAIIKCPTCGKTFDAMRKDLHSGQLMYHCDACGSNFQVEFFDHCPNCHINVGFVDTGSFADDMKKLGIGLAKAVFNPLSAVTSFGGFFLDGIDSSVKDCNGDGVCPICKERFLRCPTCSELTVIARRAIFTDKFNCKHCNQTILPCSSIRPGKERDHSKAFYAVNTNNFASNSLTNAPSNEFITGIFSNDFQTCINDKMKEAINNIDSIEELVNYYAEIYYHDVLSEQTNYYFLLAILLTEKLENDLFIDLDSDDFGYNYALINKAQSYVKKAYDSSNRDREIHLFMLMYGLWGAGTDKSTLWNYIESFPKLKEKEEGFFLTTSYITKLWHAHISAVIEKSVDYVRNTSECPNTLKFWVDKFKSIAENYDSNDNLHFSWMKMADNLAVTYIDGLNGVTVDYSKALELLNITVNVGKRFQGMCNLGEMYEKGSGVKQDYSKAREYYNLVIDNANEESNSYKYAKERLEGMNNSTSINATNLLTSKEQEYLDEFKYMMEDGEISPRERRLLDKIRTQLGISEDRATELEASLSSPTLTPEEQEYFDEYKEIIAEGEISPRDQRFPEKLKKANGISDERVKEIENLVK